MDVAQWKRLHITQDIEKWMGKYRESKKDLIEIAISFAHVCFQPEVIRLQIRELQDIYKFGMSQPPWLLALHKKYRKLGLAPKLRCAFSWAIFSRVSGPEWNCRGLGRDTLSLKDFVPSEVIPSSQY